MAESQENFNLLDPFSAIDLGIAESTNGIKKWAIANRDIIQPIKHFFNELILGIDRGLNAVPPSIMLILLVLFAWQAAGRRVALLVGVAMVCLGLLSPGAWSLAMTTLAIVISAVILSFIIGLPLGILAGKNDRFLWY